MGAALIKHLRNTRRYHETIGRAVKSPPEISQHRFRTLECGFISGFLGQMLSSRSPEVALAFLQSIVYTICVSNSIEFAAHAGHLVKRVGTFIAKLAWEAGNRIQH